MFVNFNFKLEVLALNIVKVPLRSLQFFSVYNFLKFFKKSNPYSICGSIHKLRFTILKYF